MTLDSQYYYPGKHHNCMFCSTPIALLRNGKLSPLGNKSHILLEKTKPGLFVFNCCAGCMQQINLEDQALLDQIHSNVVECMELQDSLAGLLPEEINAKRAGRDADKPVVGFKATESNTRQRPKTIAKYMKYLKENS